MVMRMSHLVEAGNCGTYLRAFLVEQSLLKKSEEKRKKMEEKF